MENQTTAPVEQSEQPKDVAQPEATPEVKETVLAEATTEQQQEEPKVINFKEIIMKLLNLINKRRLLFPMPLPLASFTAKIFQLLPNPILTEDQLRLLKYDNILSGKYKSNFEIGVPSKKYFSEEVKKYAYMWREGGQFSTEKYLNKNNI